VKAWQLIGSCIGYGALVFAALMLVVDAIGPFIAFRRRVTTRKERDK
jgi:hypothetical protein